MKYIIDMAQASAAYAKHEERKKLLNLIMSIAMGVTALCIVVMTLLSVLHGPSGIGNAILILMGLSVLTTYITMRMTVRLTVAAAFYKYSKNTKLLELKTKEAEGFWRHEYVYMVFEDELGNVCTKNIGTVTRVPNTNYTEPVLHLIHERLYVPYVSEGPHPEQIENEDEQNNAPNPDATE